ncbi:MAG: putative DNA modification/repair radical SAM protein [Comamonas sp.]
MELQNKLAILADAAKYDASCASSGSAKRHAAGGGIGSTEGMGICHSYTPDGRCVSLLKILLTNFCIYDCKYCVNRVSSNIARARFTVQEVVDLTLDFYKRNCIEGLFLSSGIIRSPDYTMEQLVAVARSLRLEHGFKGYIHLKTIPDADPVLLAEAGLYADRLSINIELPTVQGLNQLAPEKDSTTIHHAMGQLHDHIANSKAERTAAAKTSVISMPRSRRTQAAKPQAYAPGGQSTQMIVGADGADDGDIILTSSKLYSGYGLRRVYYSAFSPIPDSSKDLPLMAPPLVREHRLYQADWLMRFYGFDAQEIVPAGANGQRMLSLEHDPKLAWALAHRERFPVNLNTAPREMLLRVPGLGVKSVDKLLMARRWRMLHRHDLNQLKVPVDKILPFVECVGWQPGRRLDDPMLAAKLVQPMAPQPVQASLF